MVELQGVLLSGGLVDYCKLARAAAVLCAAHEEVSTC